jgi:hypothetical protein
MPRIKILPVPALSLLYSPGVFNEPGHDVLPALFRPEISR